MKFTSDRGFTKMIKRELIENISKKAPAICEKNVNDGVNCILEFISDGLEKSRRIEVRGFGVFTKKSYLRGSSRNPDTGETFLNKKTTNLKFKAGKLLRNRVNKHN